MKATKTALVLEDEEWDNAALWEDEDDIGNEERHAAPHSKSSSLISCGQSLWWHL